MAPISPKANPSPAVQVPQTASTEIIMSQTTPILYKSIPQSFHTVITPQRFKALYILYERAREAHFPPQKSAEKN